MEPNKTAEKDERPETPAPAAKQPELAEKDLDKAAGGTGVRRLTGPGTQTEDEAYIGRR